MFHLLRMQGCPIYDQLLLEEKLLREDERNWCLINYGTSPAIVMGISGKKEELVNCSSAAQEGVPLIKRFSGGGTVIVDENTLFVTFICEKNLHDFLPYPEPIMKWTEGFYQEVFNPLPFSLRENDYALGDRKFGGNAQYIKKNRWLHHTSFLWDYSPQRMQHLLHPPKTPAYRQARTHTDFLCKLSPHFSNPEEVIDKIATALQTRYPVAHHSLEEVRASLQGSSRQSTHFLI